MSNRACSVVFTGDIGFDKYMDGRWKDKGLLSEKLRLWFHSADHVVANVEGALIRAEDNGSHGVFFHSMDPDAVCVLDEMHADIWNISNNHIMDAGLDGLNATAALAKEHDCRTIGAGINEEAASEPVFLKEAGGIGMIGVAYQTECIPATGTDPGVLRWDDMELIGRRIAEIKEKCRWCIVVAHGGEEFAALPNPYTRDRYLAYLEMGADVVVGHHPHVPENYEILPNGKAVFYSLGNFIFDTNYQRAHLYTDRGILLKLCFTEDAMTFDALGIQIVRGEEKIIECDLPAVFCNVSSQEYELLSPLAAKAFIQEERRKMIYLEPDRFTDADKAVWNGYFFSTEPDGYAEGAHMDLSLIIPLAERADKEEWQKSSLSSVIDYLKTMLI